MMLRLYPIDQNGEIMDGFYSARQLRGEEAK